jgi:hypothetical protein
MESAAADDSLVIELFEYLGAEESIFAQCFAFLRVLCASVVKFRFERF